MMIRYRQCALMPCHWFLIYFVSATTFSSVTMTQINKSGVRLTLPLHFIPPKILSPLKILLPLPFLRQSLQNSNEIPTINTDGCMIVGPFTQVTNITNGRLLVLLFSRKLLMAVLFPCFISSQRHASFQIDLPTVFSTNHR